MIMNPSVKRRRRYRQDPRSPVTLEALDHERNPIARYTFDVGYQAGRDEVEDFDRRYSNVRILPHSLTLTHSLTPPPPPPSLSLSSLLLLCKVNTVSQTPRVKEKERVSETPTRERLDLAGGWI